MHSTLADVVHPVHVFEHVWVVLLEFSFSSSLVVLPDNITLQVLDFVVHAVPRTLSTLNHFTNQVATTIELATHTVQVYTVFHFEVDAEVIVLVTRNTTLTTTETCSLSNLIA